MREFFISKFLRGLDKNNFRKLSGRLREPP
jgi:hypothetical protein